MPNTQHKVNFNSDPLLSTQHIVNFNLEPMPNTQYTVNFDSDPMLNTPHTVNFNLYPMEHSAYSKFLSAARSGKKNTCLTIKTLSPKMETGVKSVCIL